MIGTQDVQIQLWINGYQVDKVLNMMSLKIIEDVTSLFPYGTMIVNDWMGFFNTVQLIGGEEFVIREIKRVDDERLDMVFKVLFVEMVSDKTYIIHFVFCKDKNIGFLERKISRSFTNRKASEVIRDIMTIDLKETDSNLDISDAFPLRNWIQPYITDGQMICQIRNKAYFNENYNYFAFYSLDGIFHFKAYEEVNNRNPKFKYSISDPLIKNDRSFYTMKKFSNRVYFYNISQNKFNSFVFDKLPKDESTKFSSQKQSSIDQISEVINSGSSNNFLEQDFKPLGYKQDCSYLTLEYKMTDLFSPIKLFNLVDLTLLFKNLAYTKADEKAIKNNFYSGIWMTGRIQKEYTSKGIIKTITFLRKGFDLSVDRMTTSIPSATTLESVSTTPMPGVNV